MTTTSQLPEIGLPLETMLRTQLYTALQGDIITTIIKEAKVGKTENYWRYLLEGHSFKVDEKISNKLFLLFNEVKGNLGFLAPIDFYITNSPEINASAISSIEEGEPNIININSGLLQLMNDDELKFIVGHEIGHLISKNVDLQKLIYFVFPQDSNLPSILHHKIRLWNQLSELIADRYGFMACPDLSTCISAFFKMSSGLNTQRVDLNIEAFLKENEQRLEYFRKDNGLNMVATHPINPVRVKAIDLFSKSKLFSTINNNSTGLDDKELQKQMDELTEVLLKIKNSELDYHLGYFLATSGLIIASLDNEIESKEIELITQTLSEFTVFPQSFLQNIHESGKVSEIFNSSIQSILEINPSEKEGLIGFMINMVMADKKIKNEELEFIFSIGEQAFGYTKKEVSQIFAAKIQERFVPSIIDLS